MRTSFLAFLIACSNPPSVNHATSASTIGIARLHDLTRTDGYRVRSKLLDGKDGHLYGTAWHGGSNDCGTAFAWDTVTSTYAVTHDFSALDATGRNDDGCGPVAHASLHAGRIWIVTPRGGRGGNPIRAGVGVIASCLPPNCSDYRVERHIAYPWPSIEGGNAQGALEWDESHGVAYLAMAGSIWRFDPSTRALALVYSFPPRASDGTNKIGANPYGSPVPFGSSLIGWTLYGGPFGAGGVYLLDPDQGIATPAYAFPSYTFTGNTDNTPLGSPFVASDGAAYLAVEFGGALGSGMLLKFERTATVVHEFGPYPYAPDGALPIGEPAEGPDGSLEGTTMYGDRGYGLLWRILKDGRSFSVIATLAYPDTCYPYAGLTLAGGKMYGVDGLCGAAGGGSILGIDL